MAQDFRSLLRSTVLLLRALGVQLPSESNDWCCRSEVGFGHFMCMQSLLTMYGDCYGRAKLAIATVTPIIERH